MKNVVIKLGGSVVTDPSYRQSIVNQLFEVKKSGVNPILVHGGGKLITYYLDKLGIESEFVDGLRVTSEAARDVVLMALSKVNKDLVFDFNALGDNAIGLCGGDDSLIYGEKIVHSSGKDLGYVAQPKRINTKLLDQLTSLGYTLVISAIGVCSDGYYNINADHSAAFVAQALKADYLIYVSDVNGVMNPTTGETYTKLDSAKISKLKEQGVITAGMIPKLETCLASLNAGVSHVCILNGKIETSIVDYILHKQICGSEIASM